MRSDIDCLHDRSGGQLLLFPNRTVTDYPKAHGFLPPTQRRLNTKSPLPGGGVSGGEGLWIWNLWLYSVYELTKAAVFVEV